MKKLLLFIPAFLIGPLVYSQVLIALLLGDKLNTGKIEFGLDGGVNFASISNMDSNSYDRSWNLGFYFDFKLKNQWYLSTGVLVKSTMGIDNLTEDDLEFLQATTYDVEGNFSQKISYFIVPALAKYNFDNHIFIEGGPQFALMYKAHIEFETDQNRFEDDGDDLEVLIKQDNKDDINRIDMGLTAGVGYRLLKGLGWTIGARYYYGLTNVYKERSGTRNNGLFLRLNVPIGISKEKKEEIKTMKDNLHAKKAKKKEAKKQAKEENKSH
jgi:hypothetical protein